MSVRFWWTLSASLLVGLIFANIPDTADGAFDLIGAIFNFVNLATVPLMSAAVPLIMERAVYYREISSGTYRKTVYAMAVELAELPFNLLMAVVSWVIFYWLIGLDSRVDRVFYNLLMSLAVYWILPLFGQLFSFISPNLGIASVIGGILLVAFTLTMGFLIPPGEIPVWWVWIYWINPLRYVLQGLAINELGDGKQYFNEATGGYESGDDILGTLGGWSFDQRWWYCYVVVLMFGFAASFGLIGATRINWMKR
jgi:ABC-type multidrug transport system permease subunit